MTEMKPARGRGATLTWTVEDAEPAAFADVFELVKALIAAGLPGSQVTNISLTGDRLTVEVGP